VKAAQQPAAFTHQPFFKRDEPRYAATESECRCHLR
jgi:hypothetical protein